MNALKRLQSIGSTFASELQRHQSVMMGHRSYRVSLQAPPAMRKLLPDKNFSNIIWHVVVAGHCSMQELQNAIAKEGNFCSSADRAAVKRLIENGNFKIGQCRAPKGRVGRMSKP